MQFPRCITIVTLVFAFTAVSITNAANTENMKKSASENSKQILQDLYITLQNILFPKSSLSSDREVSNRFVLMSPGKVLNYFDYFPGLEYEESLLRKNTSAREVVVPPAVMEKWFDIADVMVGGDPFNGGTTGKSLANVYRTVVSQMEVKDIKKTSQAAQERYDKAYNYLTTQVPDPNDLSRQTTRLAVYSYYQDRYTQRQLEMEDKIDEARRSRGSVDFELWFQRHYTALNSRVETAYMEWLVFGQKDMVELYKAYVDTSSSGVEVEDAKMALRASGVESLDRTRTIYPVSFEPGNWYKYLLPKIKGPSRDMLLTQRSILESEKDALTAMIDFQQPQQGLDANSSTLNKMQQRVNSAQSNQEIQTKALMTARSECMQQINKESPPCKRLSAATENAVDASFKLAQARSELFSAAFFLGSTTKYKNFLGTRIAAIDRQLELINNQLNSTKSNSYLGEIAESLDFSNLDKLMNLTEQNLDDAWLQFEYDSDSSHISKSSQSLSVDYSAGLSVSIFDPENLIEIDAGESITSSLNVGEIEEAMNSASVKVSGEVLRVTIKRPWFKPSIFEDPNLTFQQTNGKLQKTYVSPGPYLTEAQLRDVVNNHATTDAGAAAAGVSNVMYLLPEYVTSFALARDLRLQFFGVDTSMVSDMIRVLLTPSLSVSFDMFTMSGSLGLGGQSQFTTADRTSDGMIIRIPGAQIIGYYTQVLPQFPRVD